MQSDPLQRSETRHRLRIESVARRCRRRRSDASRELVPSVRKSSKLGGGRRPPTRNRPWRRSHQIPSPIPSSRLITPWSTSVTAWPRVACSYSDWTWRPVCSFAGRAHCSISSTPFVGLRSPGLPLMPTKSRESDRLSTNRRCDARPGPVAVLFVVAPSGRAFHSGSVCPGAATLARCARLVFPRAILWLPLRGVRRVSALKGRDKKAQGKLKRVSRASAPPWVHEQNAQWGYSLTNTT